MLVAFLTILPYFICDFTKDQYFLNNKVNSVICHLGCPLTSHKGPKVTGRTWTTTRSSMHSIHANVIIINFYILFFTFLFILCFMMAKKRMWVVGFVLMGPVGFLPLNFLAFSLSMYRKTTLKTILVRIITWFKQK